jgi:hypothetical protein
MSKKKHLSHDQKRKAKLAKRAAKAPQVVDLAYRGDRYKHDDLLPLFFQADLGIYQAYVMSGKTIVDRTVASALTRLVLQMQRGGLPPLADPEAGEAVGDDAEELIIWNIRRNWNEYFRDNPHAGTEQLIGVLRTTLGSIQVWTTRGRDSRGYLRYLKGFLRQAGVTVEEAAAESETLSPEEDDLLFFGREWLDTGDPAAGSRFKNAAEALIQAGKGELVAETSQQLIGEFGEVPEFPELSVIAIKAQNSRALPGQ